MELIFSGYSSDELSFDFLNFDIALVYKANNLWERKKDFAEIEQETIFIETKESRSSEELGTSSKRSVTKSKYVFTIVLARNPVSAIFYIIIPTMAITLYVFLV